MKSKKIGCLPESISVAVAADLLGGPEFVCELLYYIGIGDLFSWTRSPWEGPCREVRDKKYGDLIRSLERVRLTDDPSDVVVCTADLEMWFFHYGVSWPPSRSPSPAVGGSSEIHSLSDLVKSRNGKIKRAPWAQDEQLALWAAYSSFENVGRGALTHFVDELKRAGLSITRQALEPQLVAGERLANLSRPGDPRRAPVGTQLGATPLANVWAAAKPATKSSRRKP
jgi:hypothetical protein